MRIVEIAKRTGQNRLTRSWSAATRPVSAIASLHALSAHGKALPCRSPVATRLRAWRGQTGLRAASPEHGDCEQQCVPVPRDDVACVPHLRVFRGTIHRREMREQPPCRGLGELWLGGTVRGSHESLRLGSRRPHHERLRRGSEPRDAAGPSAPRSRLSERDATPTTPSGRMALRGSRLARSAQSPSAGRRTLLGLQARGPAGLPCAGKLRVHWHHAEARSNHDAGPRRALREAPARGGGSRRRARERPASSHST